MRRALSLAAASFALSLLAVRDASASPAYPDVLKETLALPEAPPCTTCHATPAGGFGTATQPFATYLKSRGLVAADVGSLQGALAAAVGEKHDSDGDGTSDVDALRAGDDPNGATDSSVPPPAYGCGARIASRDPSPRASLATLPLIAAALAWARRRRRRAAPVR